MKIECILKREGGTKVDLDGTNYHFKPETVAGDLDHPHVCNVTIKPHIKTFLAIDVYEFFDGADDEFGAEADHEAGIETETAPAQSAVAMTGVDDTEGANLADPVTDETPIIEANEEPAANDVDPIGAEAGEPAREPSTAETEKPFEDMDLHEARVAFKNAFEREAHPRAKAQSIIKKLVELRDAAVLDSASEPTE